MLPAVFTALNWCILFYPELVPYQPNFVLNCWVKKHGPEVRHLGTRRVTRRHAYTEF